MKVRGANGRNPWAAGEAEGRPRLLRGDDVGVHQLGPARIQAGSPVQEHDIMITHAQTKTKKLVAQKIYVLYPQRRATGVLMGCVKRITYF